MHGKGAFIVLVTLVALIVVAAGVAVGWRVVRGDGSLLRDVSLAHGRITPNADGEQDVTTIAYTISRNAAVSIYFEDATGERYYFRNTQPRGAGDYEVYFSGIVDGFRLSGERYEGEILSRLLADGDYVWTVEARDEVGVVERQSGELTIAEADTTVPEIRNFTLDRRTFTPNRDGIGDRVQVEFELTKEVADLSVFVQMPDGTELPIAEKPMETPPDKPGRHIFDYAGGVDEGAAPPPDGTYPVVAVAQDAEGQKVRVEEKLTVRLGGVPYAKVLSPVTGDTVAYNTTAVEICDTLTFTVTVYNYGDTPIRTVGPWSGAVYDSDWNYNTMGWPTESGAWRLGIGYENSLGDYPYRWGLGSPAELTKIDGQYYLMPEQRVVVSGGIRVVDVFGVRNPQPMWAGLIHEDVEISLFNNRVDPKRILVDIPDPDHVPACEERDAPQPVKQSGFVR